ncbi:catecholate siderophore receptor Fiu [Thauera butanivorans]|uniref:catecholate siderophore receptor Fiu n=1 Tax=Thauera butanivorans TaxID=86174 RepID=UPI000838F980|nr:catecholate siderophore receptor Fiu [Thauera butanivorans]
MAHIESQKHTLPQQPRLHQTTALTLLALALPGTAAAQQAAQTPTLPKVEVTASGEQTYKADTVSSPKFTQPLVDTPQTITVIKKEILREQQATSLTEALRNTPGITMLLGEGGNSNQKDNIFMRGFDTSGSVFIDNVRDLGNFGRDTFNVEQIEISKGAVGADNGRGAPSGYVNLSSKSPFADNALSGSISYGSAENLRMTADMNRQLGETSAFRLNVMKQDGGVAGRDHVESKRWGIAPSIAFGLDTPTRTTLSYLHVEQDNVPDGGIPTVGLKGYYNAALAAAGIGARKVDTENFYGSKHDFEDVSLDMFTVKVEHDIAPGTTVRNTSRWGKVRHELLLTAPGSANSSATNPNGINAGNVNNPETWTVTRSRQTKWQENELLTNQTNLTTEFSTGPLAHSLSAGLEFIHERQLTKTLVGAGSMVPGNLYDPSRHDPVSNYDLGTDGRKADGETTTIGAYLFDTAKLGERWQFTAGVRLDRYRTEARNVVASTATSHPALPVGTLVPLNIDAKDTLTSWKVGALYKPAANGSIYAAYATSKQPPGGSNFTLSATGINNPNMDPQEARTIELGTKWDLLDERLAFTAAIYRTENKNDLTQTDPVTGDVTQWGKKTVKGIELGLVGAITPAWQVSAGLARMKTEVEEGSTSQQGNAVQWSPELSFTAWTTYRLPFGLTVGGGARYVDSMLRSSNDATATTNMPEVDDYWVYDAMASYEISKNVSLQLNVYNLTDKKYVASMNNNGARYTPGTPRSALLSANFQF